MLGRRLAGRAALLSALGIGWLTVFAWNVQIPLVAGLLGWVVGGIGMGLTMPSTAVATMTLSGGFEQGRNQSSLQVAESVGNSVVTAVAGAIYTALLLADPPQLSYAAALGAVLILSIAAVLASKSIGHIDNELRAG